MQTPRYENLTCYFRFSHLPGNQPHHHQNRTHTYNRTHDSPGERLQVGVVTIKATSVSCFATCSSFISSISTFHATYAPVIRLYVNSLGRQKGHDILQASRAMYIAMYMTTSPSSGQTIRSEGVRPLCVCQQQVM